MTEITFEGEPIRLKGQQINEDDFAPDFAALDDDLNQVALTDYAGKKKLISVIPSVDTGVRDQQIRKFNSEAPKEEGIVLTTSADLPFAQKEWCTSVGLDNVITLSDHHDLSSSKNYGVITEEFRSLTYAVFVLDADNRVVYKEIVSEGTDFSDFDAALAAYKNI